MNNPLISIILPTYNVYSYLAQCLDSIVAQTYKNIEVIIVIDGANDGSYELAKEYCQRDRRFSVYWQENAGSGPARNNGLLHANGQFVIFIDPDDWVKEDFVETMVHLIEKDDYDLVTTKETAVYFNDKGKQTSIVEYHSENKVIKGQEDVRKSYVELLSKGLIAAPHCKIYKNSIIKQNNIRFPDLRRSQDVVFNYRYYNYISNVLVCDYSGYMYRVLRKDRALRLPKDYYLTIKVLYADICKLHQSWNIAFDKLTVCNDFYVSIQAHLESNIIRGQSIKNIVEDETIYDIIKSSRPTKIHFALTRWLILRRHYLCASWLISALYHIKAIIH